MDLTQAVLGLVFTAALWLVTRRLASWLNTDAEWVPHATGLAAAAAGAAASGSALALLLGAWDLWHISRFAYGRRLVANRQAVRLLRLMRTPTGITQAVMGLMGRAPSGPEGIGGGGFMAGSPLDLPGVIGEEDQYNYERMRQLIGEIIRIDPYAGTVLSELYHCRESDIQAVSSLVSGYILNVATRRMQFQVLMACFDGLLGGVLGLLALYVAARLSAVGW
jgi:hypothetical protein